jgi:hypothetical protein
LSYYVHFQRSCVGAAFQRTLTQQLALQREGKVKIKNNNNNNNNIEAAQRKRIKYEVKCVDIGYGFLPFSFSSFGELEKDAVTLLKRIRRFFTTQDTGARAAVHIFNMIGFAIARGVGA